MWVLPPYTNRNGSDRRVKMPQMISARVRQTESNSGEFSTAGSVLGP
jgi:hypothetical protein